MHSKLECKIIILSQCLSHPFNNKMMKQIQDSNEVAVVDTSIKDRNLGSSWALVDEH